MRPLFPLLLASFIAHAQPNLSGASRLRLSVEKLNRLGRVLYIAAHPDDENTAFLALSSRGLLYRTAYLSLTRGEGGQNLIGSEQGEWMGLIRTQELLAARRIDGAEQYFSRAIDFGFSKTAEETLTKWDREKVLGDVVYVIRRFQPDIVVLRFSGTPRDGHGQHQASSILGREAFAAAADPDKYPDQKLPPWQTKRIFLNLASFTRAMEQEAEAAANKVTLDLGAYDPVLGYSFGEIAGISRSQHRSQAMGAREDRGSQRNYFQVLAGAPVSKDLMEGIDATWARVPNSAKVAALLAKAAKDLNDRAPEKIVPTLLEARRELQSLDQSNPFVIEKLADLNAAILQCAGLFLDVSAARFHAVAGKPLDVAFTAINRGGLDVKLALVHINGKTIPIDKPLVRGQAVNHIATENAPAVLTQPYWLAHQKSDTMYDIRDLRDLDRPDGPLANNTTGFTIAINGEPQFVQRPILHRYVDRTYGELTRPLVVVPPAVVRIGEKATLFPNGKPREVAVQVTAMDVNTKGIVKLFAPAGWKITPTELPFTLDAAEQGTLKFTVTPPAAEQTATLKAEAVVDGKSYGLTMTTVDYPHIPPQSAFTPAEAKLVRADIAVLSKNIGYIMGSGDEVPRALEQLGCSVTILTKEALAQEDLSRYDAIVAGVRAFNTRADVRSNARRLHDYAKNGGTFVVQYNVMEGGFFGGNPKLLENIGPYPIMLSPGRVTVEEAPVEFAATHALMTRPNRITAKDFDGWIQERGLYFASAWDPKYETLFEMHDPGEKQLKGGTLYAKYGKGAYIFTPLSWFRQLPAGVPGAYRIFANFLSAGRAQ
ncbi:MAG: PIG-L family deacetylase [Acidobacteria bacterium]|nr:PIG-L family deacetylase [Acidobacteriota bacterium]